MRSSIVKFGISGPSDDDFFKMAMRTGCSVAILREEWEDALAESWSDDQAEINHENGKPWPPVKENPNA